MFNVPPAPVLPPAAAAATVLLAKLVTAKFPISAPRLVAPVFEMLETTKFSDPPALKKYLAASALANVAVRLN